MDSLNELKIKLRQFAADRDWDQFHSPKNLSMALCGEIGELADCFQWLTESESTELSGNGLARVAEEIADIQLYLIRLADKLNIDLIEESNKKIQKNAARYPIEKSKGRADKYTEL